VTYDHRPAAKGRRAYASGLAAEARACAAVEQDGWTILGRRLRTPAGEIDAVAQKAGILVFLEVKSRPSLAAAAAALTQAQRRRLLASAAILLAANPLWGETGVRFDVLLVDPAGRVRRIIDAFRDDAQA
jgi:putative endonuclease